MNIPLFYNITGWHMVAAAAVIIAIVYLIQWKIRNPWDN